MKQVDVTFINGSFTCKQIKASEGYASEYRVIQTGSLQNSINWLRSAFHCYVFYLQLNILPPLQDCIINEQPLSFVRGSWTEREFFLKYS